MSRGDLLLGWLPKMNKAMLLPAIDEVFSENNADIELTEDRIRHLVDILDIHFLDLRAVNERRLLSELQLVYPEQIHADSSDTALPATVVQSYLQRASSIFTREGTGFLLGRLCSFQEAIEVGDPLFGRVEDIHGDVQASLVAKEAIRMLGLPEDLPAQCLPDYFACDCEQLDYPLSFAHLVQHLLDEVQWYEDMIINLYVFPYIQACDTLLSLRLI